MFDDEIKEIKSYIKRKDTEKKSTCFQLKEKLNWPSGEGRNIIFKEDVGVEIGNPSIGSVSFLVWTDKKELVDDGRVTIIGPDIHEATSTELPFCKIVIASIEGFDKDNTFERYREMESIRYDIDLKGYMMKGMSQYQREWSRISKEAIANNFSFRHLGSALMEKFRETGYVTGVETVFITESPKAVGEMAEVAGQVGRVISAMNKMLEEMSLDCDSCEYVDICDQVKELKEMKEELAKAGISSSLEALE